MDWALIDLFFSYFILECFPWIKLKIGLKLSCDSGLTVVMKQQAEEVGKRVPKKMRAQGNYKHKTRAW